MSATADVALSAWELACQAVACTGVAGQQPLRVDRERPLNTLIDSPIGHATGTLPSPYHPAACGRRRLLTQLKAKSRSIETAGGRRGCRTLVLYHFDRQSDPVVKAPLTSAKPSGDTTAPGMTLQLTGESTGTHHLTGKAVQNTYITPYHPSTSHESLTTCKAEALDVPSIPLECYRHRSEGWKGAMELTEREMLVKTLQDAEADLRKKTTYVELRMTDVDKAQAALEEALEKQVMVQNTCDWLRERINDFPDERDREAKAALTPRPALEPIMESEVSAGTAPADVPPGTAQKGPASAGVLFGKPIPEVTNTGLSLRALEQIGTTATTTEIREKISESGHVLSQSQVRGALKYLAGRHDAPVENPEPGVWRLRRDTQPVPADANGSKLSNAMNGS